MKILGPENVKYIWNSKQDVFGIPQSFQTSGRTWGNCSLQREGHFQKFQHKNIHTPQFHWIYLHTAQHLTAIHVTLTDLSRKLKGQGRKLHMDNFFSSRLAQWPDKQKSNWFWTVITNRKARPKDLGPMWIEQKWFGIQVRMRADFTAILWRKTTTHCGV